MKNCYVLFFFLLFSPLYPQQSFNQLQQNFQQKKYGLTIRQGASILEASFKNILLQSYQYLPYTHSISRSNHTYSFDMQNQHINFNTQIEYFFSYTPSLLLKLSLVYSFEEVSYYETYINNGNLTSLDKDLIIASLNEPLNGSVLWNIDQSTAYYVYSFPQTKNKSPVTDNIVPGLLLKIQFPKNTKYSTNIITVLTNIIQKADWKNLQKLYFID